MQLTIDDLLGQAYHKDQVEGQRPAAVALLRDGLKGTDLQGMARVRLGELSAIVTARTSGGRCHAHIEKICADLLKEALG